MKIVVILFLLVVYSQTIYGEPNKAIKHSHGERVHTHPLPDTGLKHSHNKGNKNKKKKKLVPLSENQKIANAVTNYKDYISGRKKLNQFSIEEKKYMIIVKDYYANKKTTQKEQQPSDLTSDSSKKQKACVKYRKDYGWSNGYSVVATVISGSDLNTSVGSITRFDAFSTYAVVFWKNDQATILKLPPLSMGSLPMFESEVEDQNGKKWQIKEGHLICY